MSPYGSKLFLKYFYKLRNRFFTLFKFVSEVFHEILE